MMDVNLLAIALAAVANMIVGSLWYSPILFGKKWMELERMDPNMKPEGMGKKYVQAYLVSLVFAFVLATILNMTSGSTLIEALKLGFLLWLGLIATIVAMGHIFDPHPEIPKTTTLFLINSGNYLVAVLAMMAVISIWA